MTKYLFYMKHNHIWDILACTLLAMAIGAQVEQCSYRLSTALFRQHLCCDVVAYLRPPSPHSESLPGSSRGRFPSVRKIDTAVNIEDPRLEHGGVCGVFQELHAVLQRGISMAVHEHGDMGCACRVWWDEYVDDRAWLDNSIDLQG